MILNKDGGNIRSIVYIRIKQNRHFFCFNTRSGGKMTDLQCPKCIFNCLLAVFYNFANNYSLILN